MKKTTKPIIRIHDIETNEVIDREMNDVEYAAYETSLAIEAEKKVEAEIKENAKTAILDRIGLTVDELKTILG
jgi:hypothetical protein